MNRLNKIDGLEISATLIVGFDKGKEESCLTVSKYDGSKLINVNTFTGWEAEDLYSRLVFGVPVKKCEYRLEKCKNRLESLDQVWERL